MQSILFLYKIEAREKQRRKTMKQKNSGITLIALVVTIIVLLILAGVSLASISNSGQRNYSECKRRK